MEIVYKATPRRLDLSDDDDDEDENVIFTANGLKGSDEQALMKGSRNKSSGRQPGILVRAPGRVAVTLTLFLSFFGCGVILSLLGPTLLDLSCNVNSSLQSVVYVFTSRSIGYVVGSIVSGVVFDRFDANLLLAIALPCTALATTIIPFWKSVAVLAVSTFFQGISMGFLDSGGNVLLLRLWGKENGPYMQTLHFSFGLGAFISPLLAKPFLSPAPSSNCTSVETAIMTCAVTTLAATSAPTLAAASATAHVATSIATTMASSTLPSTIMTAVNASITTIVTSASIVRQRRVAGDIITTSLPPLNTDLDTVADCVLPFTGTFKYAYFLSGIPLFIAGALFSLFAWRKRKNHMLEAATKDSEGLGEGSDGGNTAAGGKTSTAGACVENGMLIGCVRYQFLFLLALFFLLYVGEEVSYGAFIYSYGVKDKYLLMTSDSAALLTADYWGLFALGRFLAIPLAWCNVPPGALVAMDLVGSLIATTMLLVLQKSRSAVWFGSGLLGLSMASVFPSAISWADQYTEINTKAAIFFVLGAAIGEMLGPLVLGYLFNENRLGPPSLMVFALAVTTLATLVFLAIFAMARSRSLKLLWQRRAAILTEGKRRMRKTRRERNAAMEMAKPEVKSSMSSKSSQQPWHSSDSDVV